MTTGERHAFRLLSKKLPQPTQKPVPRRAGRPAARKAAACPVAACRSKPPPACLAANIAKWAASASPIVSWTTEGRGRQFAALAFLSLVSSSHPFSTMVRVLFLLKHRLAQLVSFSLRCCCASRLSEAQRHTGAAQATRCEPCACTPQGVQYAGTDLSLCPLQNNISVKAACFLRLHHFVLSSYALRWRLFEHVSTRGLSVLGVFQVADLDPVHELCVYVTLHADR